MNYVSISIIITIQFLFNLFLLYNRINDKKRIKLLERDNATLFQVHNELVAVVNQMNKHVQNLINQLKLNKKSSNDKNSRVK